MEPPVELSQEELERLASAPSLSEFHRQKLDKDAKKNWDLFYKRNGNRFFKSRYWTRREFGELFECDCCTDEANQNNKFQLDSRILLEVGCGCGDFALTILEPPDDNCPEGKYRQLCKNVRIYCCDISDQAIELLKISEIYKQNYPSRIKAFVYDFTRDDGLDSLSEQLDGNLVNFVSLIFVLSAIDPLKMGKVVENLDKIAKPGCLVFVRDYAIYDQAMLRFGDKSKICDQFYMRQDGTRAYFFNKEQLVDLFEESGKFHCQSVDYVKRDTFNNETRSEFTRIFLQAKFIKL